MSTACDWPLIHVCDPGGCTHLASLVPDLRVAVESAAIDWLYQATGRRFGRCPVTVTVSSSPCGWPPRPLRTERGWVNCGSRCERLMPGAPVLSVIEVRVNGVELPDTDYHVENRKWLVRTDGVCWPRTGIEVTYVPGLAVPESGKIAAAVLACQLARAACNDKCDLPQNWQTATRQGVTVSRRIEPLPSERTGVWVIDSFIESANRPRASVYSPDVDEKRRVVTWAAS